MKDLLKYHTKWLIPSLGLCSGTLALSLRGRSHGPLHKRVARRRASLLPCQPAPSAARAAPLLAAWAGKVRAELADAQAQPPSHSSGLGRRGKAATSRPFWDSPSVRGCAVRVETGKQRWKETTSFPSLLLNAGSHSNQQHVVAHFLQEPSEKKL